MGSEKDRAEAWERLLRAVRGITATCNGLSSTPCKLEHKLGASTWERSVKLARDAFDELEALREELMFLDRDIEEAIGLAIKAMREETNE